MFSQVDVLPDVELGPVRQREDADRSRPCRLRALYRLQSSGRWFFGSQRCCAVAEREDALLGARLLLVAARAAERRVEAVLVQRLLQRLRLHDVGVHGRAVVERVDALRATPSGLMCTMQVEPVLARRCASRNAIHLPELPGRVDVQQRERRRRRDGTPSAPGAASPRSPCRSSRASPGSRTRRRPRG